MSSHSFDQAQVFLADKDKDPSRLQETLAVSERAYTKLLFALLQCENKRVKNRTAKLVAHFSEQKPRLVFPYWDGLVECLEGKENILRWNALMTLGQIAPLDSGDGIQALLPTLYELLEDESMVTAGHAIACLGKIAESHPQQRKRIVRRIMKVHESSRAVECNQILIGKVLAALESLISSADAAELSIMLKYAKSHEQSPRSSTQKIAKKISRKIHPLISQAVEK